jgi:hypothetical protein
MEFDVETWGGAIIWLVMLVLLGFAFYRAKTRRRHIGAGAAGAVYGMMNEDKRKAVEIVVADKAAAHDFEHADDDDDPPSLKLRRAGRTENERAR